MKKTTLLCAFLILAAPWSVLADEPVDPDPNSLGIYFDTDGTQMETWADPFEPLDLYVVLTRPTFDILHGIEFGITVDGAVVGNAVDVNGSGTMWPPDWENCIFGWSSPLPVGQATWLLRVSLIYTDTTSGQVTFRLHGSSPASLPGDLPVALLADGVLQQLTTPVAPGEVCAQINGEDPIIGTENADWGAIKSLYR